MKPYRHSGGTRPAPALCFGKWEVQGMETARSTCISRIWRPCEPMVSSPSKARRTSFGLRLSTSRRYVMSQKVARSPKANSPYESRAETEAAVERIHERFKHVRAAIAKEKGQKTSAAADSHPRPGQSALEREALQQSLGALTEARDSLNAARKIVSTSIDTVKRTMAAKRLRDA